MELNEKQRQGLQIAVDRYNSGKKCEWYNDEKLLSSSIF